MTQQVLILLRITRHGSWVETFSGEDESSWLALRSEIIRFGFLGVLLSIVTARRVCGLVEVRSNYSTTDCIEAGSLSHCERTRYSSVDS